MTVRRVIEAALAAAAVVGLARIAWGQSSSLFLQGEQGPAEQKPLAQGFADADLGQLELGNEVLQQSSFVSVELPEPRKFRVHDLITILVKEKKKYESEADVEQGKEVGLKATLAKWFRIHNHKWMQQGFEGGVPEIDFSLSGDWEGDGKVEREDEFTTRITAEVIDVKPNGNLVLQARTRITNDEEEQVVMVTGVCRSVDVSADNTVLSTQVADLVVQVRHGGALRDTTRRGWIPRALDWLRPF